MKVDLYTASTSLCEKSLRVVNHLIGLAPIYAIGYLAYRLVSRQATSKPYVYAFYISLCATALVTAFVVRKLAQLKISHIIIQNTKSDGVIPRACSLAEALKEQELIPSSNRIMLESEDIDHNCQLPGNIQTELDQKIDDFISSPN